MLSADGYDVEYREVKMTHCHSTRYAVHVGFGWSTYWSPEDLRRRTFSCTAVPRLDCSLAANSCRIKCTAYRACMHYQLAVRRGGSIKTLTRSCAGHIEDDFIAHSRYLCGGWRSYSNAKGHIAHFLDKSAPLLVFAHAPPFVTFSCLLLVCGRLILRTCRCMECRWEISCNSRI